MKMLLIPITEQLLVNGEQRSLSENGVRDRTKVDYTKSEQYVWRRGDHLEGAKSNCFTSHKNTHTEEMEIRDIS